MGLTFKEFLQRVEGLSTQITALGADIEKMEGLIATYSTMSAVVEVNVAVSHARELSQQFFAKATDIKHSIAQFVKEEPCTDTNRHMHIQSLYKRLSVQINQFTRCKQALEVQKDERMSSFHQHAHPHTPELTQSPHYLSGPPGSGEQHPLSPQTQKIEELVVDLVQLESLSIELGSIIEAGGEGLDKVSLFLKEVEKATEGSNTEIARTIVKRKRRRVLKAVLFTLTAIVVFIVTVYFGGMLLEFIGSIRKAFGH
ncbi:hypothetical protein NEDG_02028 [Nematocida displodere]|uniref:t-SNARE coiled-coil homology domain-containing protein n=1 Tax=Nematocida displodere TaxID=1805483 RepID=A0A177EFJ0_9MICR|nr:hypothetical protein NEDG_02028 [Nematocida displodere]